MSSVFGLKRESQRATVLPWQLAVEELVQLAEQNLLLVLVDRLDGLEQPCVEGRAARCHAP